MRGDLAGLGYDGATVVLTGGASGIGEATVRLLGDLGATVHVADIAEPKLACASFTRFDLADADSVEAAAASLADKGAIDFLFPIAGCAPHGVGPLTSMLVNYVGTRQFTQALLPAVRDGGSVALVSSTAARNWRNRLDEHLETLKIDDPRALKAHFEAHPEAMGESYSTAKELLAIWVMQAAIDLAKTRRIRLNAIAPCPVDTPFMEETAQAIGRAFVDNYPYPLLGRMPSPEEMAWSLLLLASPLNAAVTGALLMSDQGYAGGLLTGSLAPAQYVQPAA